MNKVVGFSALYIGLFVVEILIAFISLVLVALFQYGFDLFFIEGAWQSIGLWSFWRVLFYGLPFIIYTNRYYSLFLIYRFMLSCQYCL